MPSFFRRFVTPATRHIEREQLRLRLDDAVEIDVLRVRDRLVVVGADGADAAHCHGDEL